MKPSEVDWPKALISDIPSLPSKLGHSREEELGELPAVNSFGARIELVCWDMGSKQCSPDAMSFRLRGHVVKTDIVTQHPRKCPGYMREYDEAMIGLLGGRISSSFFRDFILPPLFKGQGAFVSLFSSNMCVAR